MKDLLVLVFICILTVGLGACTSTTPEADSRAAGGSRRANSFVPGDGNTNSNVVSKVILPKDENGNPIADPAAANVDANAMISRRKTKLEAMRKAAEAAPANFDEEAMLKKATKPAPEDSEFAVILTNAAVELRTFKNHPRLLKVEKRSSGEESILRVFLKDGKIIDLPGEKIPQLGTETAAHILELAGAAS
ncbi:MAG: hypothetical protein WKF92_00355 [Pyrinomonadaceae bacterium]